MENFEMRKLNGCPVQNFAWEKEWFLTSNKISFEDNLSNNFRIKNINEFKDFYDKIKMNRFNKSYQILIIKLT